MQAKGPSPVTTKTYASVLLVDTSYISYGLFTVDPFEPLNKSSSHTTWVPNRLTGVRMNAWN
jgi:hypothetical protein